ncbi:HD domain-containing protein [Roseobacter sinensis]|uniref:HD domain-containing protein n=1 Tax=Roseobacter sinensis TaxID=2931391 RepID=A0ABT3BBB3_9RHOB|nr:HD domain-containing protein [Roseobacter sp. WL0113]MCV3270870.1 HD domain-containing protein [Roseobacter sp. WL0113]
MSDRLSAQIAFLNEADKLKSVLRASRLHDDSRFENSAEHSWHVMLHALVLAEHAPEGVQAARVLQMLLIHDLVEIDAGDTPIHGEVDVAAQEAAEQAAADRLFGLLPEDQAAAYRALWEEFEAAETRDAQFAKAIDRLTTPLANLENGGASWAAYGVTMDDMEARVGTPIGRGAPVLWAWLRPRLAAFFARAGG